MTFVNHDPVFASVVADLDACVLAACKARFEELFPYIVDAGKVCSHHSSGDVAELGCWTLRVRLTIDTKITDESGTELPLEALKPGMQAVAVLCFGDVWAVPACKAYGITPLVDTLIAF